MNTFGHELAGADWDVVGNLLSWHLVQGGIQVYDLDDHTGDWVTMSCVCEDCGHEWEAVAPVGRQGIECPECHECCLTWWW